MGTLVFATMIKNIFNKVVHVITSCNIQQGHALLKKIEGVFKLAGLLTLINGARQPPQESADNPHGWRAATVMKLALP